MSRYTPTDIEVDAEQTGPFSYLITASFTLSQTHEIRCKRSLTKVTLFVDGEEVMSTDIPTLKAKTFNYTIEGVSFKFTVRSSVVGAGFPELEVGGVIIFSPIKQRGS